MEQFFDRWVIAPHLSLAAGANARLGQAQPFSADPLSRHTLQFDPGRPGSAAREDQQNYSLWRRKRQIKFSYFNGGGRNIKTMPSKAVVSNMGGATAMPNQRGAGGALPLYLHPPAQRARARLNTAARHVLTNRNLPELAALPIGNALEFFKQLKLPRQAGQRLPTRWSGDLTATGVSGQCQPGLPDTGRSAETLSGGEAQRIRLASQIGAGLVGVMYVLDEPSIGLHQRDNAGCSTRSLPARPGQHGYRGGRRRGHTQRRFRT